MGTVYGYCRVSTEAQNIERQIRNIKAFCPNAEIIIEQGVTGTTMERPAWQKLYKKVIKDADEKANTGSEDHDTIVFDSVSRFSRDADEGFKCYQELFSKKVNLIFLKESHLNTDIYRNALQSNIRMTGGKVDIILEAVNQYLMELAREQIKLVFEQSQKEVDDLHQRTKEGIETARLNGKQIGRPKGSTKETKKSKEAKEIILKKSKSFGGSYPDDDVIKIAGISRNSYYKYKAELKAAM